MIIVHHLQNSRSQRILWLLEELGVEYSVKRYERDPQTQLAPPELVEVHPLGKSPVLEDNGTVLAESGAIIEYLARVYGNGDMAPSVEDKNYNDYVYWLHYAEGSLMPPLLLKLVFSKIKAAKMPFFVKPIAKGIADKTMAAFIAPNINRHMSFVNQHLEGRQWFTGDKPSGADIQMSFPLEAALMRDESLSSRFPNIAAFVKRVQSRKAYQRALETGGAYDYA